MAEATPEVVTIRRYLWLHEAQLAAGMLESCGIDAVVQDSHLAHMDWSYTQAVGGIQLRVPADRADEAGAVLDQLDASGPADASEMACPECGSGDVERVVHRGATFAASWLLLGFPVTRPQRAWRCARCKHLLDVPD